MTQAKTPWFVRPGVVLPLVTLIVLITILFSPSPGDGRDSRLTSYSADPGGAQLFYELAERLGWNVSRSRSRLPVVDDNTIIAVLAPPIGLRASEIDTLLGHVRRGGGLLVVAQRGAVALRDSLGIQSVPGGTTIVEPEPVRVCPESTRLFRGYWQGSLYLSAFNTDSATFARLDTLLSVKAVNRTEVSNVPAVLGVPYGAGRIVLMSDAMLLRNDAVRHCQHAFDIAAIRALEYLQAGSPRQRTRLVFDEYHQGFGSPPGSLTAILATFAETSAGGAFYQLLLGGIVLLFASAPRVIAPREVQRIERRSPLEHVDALARAYAKVGASRTATRRLLHGLRRRVERGAISRRTGASDDRFLQRVAELHPARAGEVDVVRNALQENSDVHTLVRVSQALATIEDTLTRT